MMQTSKEENLAPLLLSLSVDAMDPGQSTLDFSLLSPCQDIVLLFFMRSNNIFWGIQMDLSYSNHIETLKRR